MNGFYFLTLCIFLSPFCLTDDFPLIACQVQCLFDHILYSLPSRPLYLGQISRLHVTLKPSEWVKLRIRNKFSVRAIICFYLYLLIRQSYTHGSGLKSAFTFFITTVLWIRPNHPMNRVDVTALRTQHRIQTESNARTRPHASAGSLDRTSSLLLHYSCFLSNFSDTSACDCRLETADTVPGTSGCRCGSETKGGVASLVSESSGALTPSPPLQSHALPATSCVLDCLQQGVSISKCGKHKTENTCIFN